MPKSTKFAPFLYLMFFGSSYELFVTKLLMVDSSIWFKVYSIAEFFILLLVFDKLLNAKLRKLFICLGVAFLLVLTILFGTGNFSGFLEGDAYINTFTSLLVVLSAISWFVNSMAKFQHENLLNHPHFYFIGGLLLYFCGTYFLFLFGEKLFFSSEKNLLNYWYINLLFGFILRVNLIIGIWKEWKN